jgi:hypothetical protein
MKRLALIVVFAAFVMPLGGCLTTGTLSPPQLRPICSALVGPIHYNTFNKASRRYAADLLAMDIHQRNAIGQRLGCPQYRNAFGAL